MNLRNKLVCTTAIALAAVVSMPAFAQTLTEPTLLGRVILGYAEDGTPITAGENTTGLDAEDLAAQGGASSVDGILRQQTSVFTQLDPSDPGVSVNIRGFEGSGRVAMSVDGVPQNYRFTGHAASGIAYFDANLLSGLEVSRGAKTTVGGTGIAGSVDFRTLSATDVVDGTGFGGITRFSYGENGEKFSRMVGLGYVDDSVEAFAALSLNNKENYSDGAGDEIANTWEDSESALVKMAYHLDGAQSLSFSAMRYQSNFAGNSYEQDLTNDIYTLGYDLDTADGIWDLDVNAYVGTTATEYTAYAGSSAYGGGSYVGREMETKTVGFDATNINEATLGNWDLVSINGVEFSRDDLNGASSGVNPNEGTATRAAIFSENILTQGNWEVTAGLRALQYSQEGTTESGDIDIDFSGVDPKLTLAYQVNDWLQPYVTASRATRMPTAQESMLGGNAHGSMAFIGNPELEPEVSTGYEIGFNVERFGLFTDNDQLSGRVNYYNMDVENYILASYPSTFTNSFGETGYAFVNADGTSQTSGLEVELNYILGAFDFGLSYTKNDSDMPTQLAGLGAVQFLPEQTASLRVAAHLMDDALTVGGQYHYISGGKYASTYSTTISETNEGYDLVDLFAEYQVSDAFSVNTKVSNVFDTTYTPWLSSGTSGEGRNVYLGGEFKF